MKYFYKYYKVHNIWAKELHIIKKLHTAELLDKLTVTQLI
jgi:hypothetical protein